MNNEEQLFQCADFSRLVIWTNQDFAGCAPTPGIFQLWEGEGTFAPYTCRKLAESWVELPKRIHPGSATQCYISYLPPSNQAAARYWFWVAEIRLTSALLHLLPRILCNRTDRMWLTSAFRSERILMIHLLTAIWNVKLMTPRIFNRASSQRLLRLWRRLMGIAV